MKENLRELSVDELKKGLLDAKETIRKERFKGVTAKVENPKKIHQLKKRIARIMTIQRERELGIRGSK